MANTNFVPGIDPASLCTESRVSYVDIEVERDAVSSRILSCYSNVSIIVTKNSESNFVLLA